MYGVRTPPRNDRGPHLEDTVDDYTPTATETTEFPVNITDLLEA